eukprot:2875328-Pyramimonas_sp.AAC.1
MSAASIYPRGPRMQERHPSDAKRALVCTQLAPRELQRRSALVVCPACPWLPNVVSSNARQR